jgi:predicted transcriptional regulator of viral defense system
VGKIMDVLIEKALGQYKSHIVDHTTLSAVILNNGYISVKDKIDHLKKKGIIITLKKSLYIHNSRYTKHIISKEIIANNMLSPSYISLDYALYFHGLIPESVVDITSVTTKRSKSFATKYGVYSFTKLKKELFPIGVVIESCQNGNFLIAAKEKALCDKIYCTKDISITSVSSMIAHLTNDLRIDFDELKDFDMEIILKYYQISRSKKIKFLQLVIKGILDECN